MDDTSSWTSFIQWLFTNPEKAALFMVLITGAFRWIKELKKEIKEDHRQDNIFDLMFKENKDLLQENKTLRNEIKELRSSDKEQHSNE